MTLTRPVRALIIDDEPIARSGLREMLCTIPHMEVVGEAGTGIEALGAIERCAPDLLFLDIAMPDRGGFEVLADVTAERMPAVVFVTAFEAHALRAFEAGAVDYLLKPFDQARLVRSLRRVDLFLRGAEQGTDNGDVARKAIRDTGDGARRTEQWKWSGHRFVVRDRGTIVFVEPDALGWIESWGNYVRLMVDGRTLLLRESLASVEARLDPSRFLRISRTVIVNTQQVRRLVPKANGQIEIVLAHGFVLTASRRHRERLQRFFGVR